MKFDQGQVESTKHAFLSIYVIQILKQCFSPQFELIGFQS